MLAAQICAPNIVALDVAESPFYRIGVPEAGLICESAEARSEAMARNFVLAKAKPP